MDLTLKRVNIMLRHALLKNGFWQIENYEREGIYCPHDINHALHVARLAYIENLERGLEISKEMIYAAALIHDIGKGLEYEKGIPHDEASAGMAPEILHDSGFNEEEQGLIIGAILAHTNKEVAEEDTLRGLIYRANKKSRNCYQCKAERKCKLALMEKTWGIEK